MHSCDRKVTHPTHPGSLVTSRLLRKDKTTAEWEPAEGADSWSKGGHKDATLAVCFAVQDFIQRNGRGVTERLRLSTGGATPTAGPPADDQMAPTSGGAPPPACAARQEWLSGEQSISLGPVLRGRGQPVFLAVEAPIPGGGSMPGIAKVFAIAIVVESSVSGTCMGGTLIPSFIAAKYILYSS